MYKVEYFILKQDVSRLRWLFEGPLTTEARFRSRACPYKICGGQSGTGTAFSADTVIPRLTKITRSGITFVSRNVISRRFL
jgi:hypothetical protein